MFSCQCPSNLRPLVQDSYFSDALIEQEIMTEIGDACFPSDMSIC
jgi:hypothetical protein